MAYPNERNVVEELVQQHRQLPEPVLLALYYVPNRDVNDIFLLEVVEYKSGNYVSAERELMEVSFGADYSLRLHSNQRLQIVLTNPREFQTALKEGWPSLREIGAAVTNNQYDVIYSQEGEGDELINDLRALNAVGQNLAEASTV